MSQARVLRLSHLSQIRYELGGVCYAYVTPVAGTAGGAWCGASCGRSQSSLWSPPAPSTGGVGRDAKGGQEGGSVRNLNPQFLPRVGQATRVGGIEREAAGGVQGVRMGCTGGSIWGHLLLLPRILLAVHLRPRSRGAAFASRRQVFASGKAWRFRTTTS
eukprot:1193118-Prorocentrum_minimum.AAC.3